jgi:hypothetical protein
LRLDCSRAACDFFVNGTLVGRSSTGLPAKISDIGIFATSGWDQRFGQVTFTRFSAFELPGKTPIEPLNLGSALTSDEGLFASTGLSGAFHSYEADGFHFSPVIPFGYYSVKGGPALADMIVSADIKMEIQPGVSASRFAGLVCRASQSGMVAAVIRADGTYTVFRDTPRQPLAVLARGATDVLLPGLSENKLRLECRGSEIRFFINDALVESLNDTRYGLTFGRAGLFTKAGGDANPDAIVFRGFSVTEIME